LEMTQEKNSSAPAANGAIETDPAFANQAPYFSLIAHQKQSPVDKMFSRTREQRHDVKKSACDRIVVHRRRENIALLGTNKSSMRSESQSRNASSTGYKPKDNELDKQSSHSDSSIDAAMDGNIDQRADGPSDCYCANPTYVRDV